MISTYGNGLRRKDEGESGPPRDACIMEVNDYAQPVRAQDPLWIKHELNSKTKTENDHSLSGKLIGQEAYFSSNDQCRACPATSEDRFDIILTHSGGECPSEVSHGDLVDLHLPGRTASIESYLDDISISYKPRVDPGTHSILHSQIMDTEKQFVNRDSKPDCLQLPFSRDSPGFPFSGTQSSASMDKGISPTRPTSGLASRRNIKEKIKVKLDIDKVKAHKEMIATAPPSNIDSQTKITVNGRTMQILVQDLFWISTLGSGAFGIVDKMEHQPTGTILAVKRIPFTMNSEEQKQSLRDLDVSMRASSCPYTVTCYGSLFAKGDIWIMMEEMDTSLDKFSKLVYDNGESIPEKIIAQITHSVVQGLYYLQSKVKVMHGDVKPSNILISRNGDIKICDYGISGQLIDSVATTIKQRGSRPYLAPEKINPELGPKKGYDVRTDVWSLGISLIELATGKFPYPPCDTLFMQTKLVVFGESPRLPENTFSPDFEDFISNCLQKKYKKRPKYRRLLEHRFISDLEGDLHEVSKYVTSVLDKYDPHTKGSV